MLEHFPVRILIATVLGFLSGLGIGGGSLLILWLTLGLNMDPARARCINLLFFLPCALIACCFRWKQGMLNWKTIIPAAICGCIGTTVFSLVSVDTKILKKLFGGLLLITGIRELLYQPKQAPTNQ